MKDTQYFTIPHQIKKDIRRGEFDCSDIHISLACNWLLSKNTHKCSAQLPSNYIRACIGVRGANAVKELKDKGYFYSSYYSYNNEYSKSFVRKELGMEPSGDGKCYSYRFTDAVLAQGYSVIVYNRSEVNGNTWNSLMQSTNPDWVSAIEPKESLIHRLQSSSEPKPQICQLASGRSVFTKKGDTLGRLYSTFNMMESEYRKEFLLEGEEMVELDVSTSVLTCLGGLVNQQLQKGKTEPKDIITGIAGHRKLKNKMFGITGSSSNTPYNVETFAGDVKVGSKATHNIDYSKFIELVSSKGDLDFYEYLQVKMEGIYENPTREAAKTQAQVWLNTEDYTTYERNGEIKENEKRKKLRRRVKNDFCYGYTPNPRAGLDELFDIGGIELMREEAHMMLDKVQPVVENDIGMQTLSCHDALYVPESKAEEAKEKMKEVYREEYGIAPEIE